MANPIGTVLDLPREIVYRIAEHTTPDTFISLSQTCQKLREWLGPIEKYHLVQRLLILELTKEHGGGIPPESVTTQRGIGLPACSTKDLADLRYACVGCMKLRHHRFFSNDDLFPSRMQKPLPDDAEAKVLAEPGDARTRWGRWLHDPSIVVRPGRVHEKRAPLLRSKHIDQVHDEDKSSPGRVIFGSQRDKRLCVECHFQNGDYARVNRTNIGTIRVPAVLSRSWQVGPDTGEELEGGQSRFIVRCPQCEKWKGREVLGRGMDWTRWLCDTCSTHVEV